MRHLQRRSDVVVVVQPADGRAVPRHHRFADSVPVARRPTGQHDDFRTEPLVIERDYQFRELGDRRWRERLHRRPAGRSERDLRRQLSRLHDALRPSDRSGPRYRSVAGGSDWRGRQGSKVSIPVDLPDRLFAARSKRAVCHGQPRLSLSGRRQHVGSDQPGPDPQRPNQVRPLGRADHRRQHRRGVLLHDFRVRRIAP